MVGMGRILAVLTLVATVSIARAEPPPIEDFWKLPAFISPTISPNGKQFAVTMPLGGYMNLAVVDLETRKATAITRITDFDVINVRWVGNERLVFSLGQLNSPTGSGSFLGGGLFSVARDGSDFRKLAPTLKELRDSHVYVYRPVEYLARVPGSDDEIYATGHDRSADSADVYRLNVVSNRRTLLTFDNPGRVHTWILDREHVPRVAISGVKDELTTVVYYRESDKLPWQELQRFDPSSQSVMFPMHFDDDNKTLIVASNQGRDTMAIFRYDPAAKKLGELQAGHPRYDLGSNVIGDSVWGLVTDPGTRKVVGFAVNGDKPEVAWTDPGYQRLQKSLDAALPDTFNSFTRTPDGKRLLVTARSDRRPTRWYLLDEEKRSLESLFASRPWLTPEKLVDMRPVRIKSRDGLEFPGYLLLPSGRKDGERLPAVVHIHGGPWARADTWGFGTFGSVEGQLLASRGYAVLVPNFRGSTGFGGKVFTSAKRQFGKTMQEDIEDATDWLVKEGYADAARICLSGASYGGYATLMGLAKTPDKYKCGISGLAVTDLELLMTSGDGDIPRNESGLKFWKSMAGDPQKDRDMLRAASPAYLGDRIKAPVLMYSGVDDIRVPLEQPKKMRDALEKNGRKVVWIQKNEEGHGFGKVENNVDLYTQVLRFLEQHIGGGAK